MRRTTILADEALVLEARALAARRGTTFTGLVQEALAEYVTTHKEEASGLSIVGIGSSGASDIATRTDEILSSEISPTEGWSPDRRAAAETQEGDA